MTVRLLKSLLTVALLLGGSACSHYRLGTGAAPDFTTIHVAPVLSRALIPQAQPLVSAQIREAFIRDGRVTPENNAAIADVVLTVTLLSYAREVATVRPGDTGLARKFDVTLTAELTLRDNRSGTDRFTRRLVAVKRQLFTDSGQVQAEYELLPLLAADLAKKARHAVLDVW
jgi:hypothetical protein